jgi:putative component of toxin-antitoxin plasmid stabilization module
LVKSLVLSKLLKKMSTFVLQEIQVVVPNRLRFYSLNECKYCPFDRVCKAESKEDAVKKYGCQLSEWDRFLERIPVDNPNFKKQLNTILARLDSLALLEHLPPTKFKDVTPKYDLVKEYEIKTADLRVYMFHLKEFGRIVVLGGIKGTQASDFKRFRNLKKAYLHSLK